MNIFKAAILGVAAVLLALQFKQTKNEYGAYLSMAAGLIIFGYALSQLGIVVTGIQKIADYISIDSKYIMILMKVIGIAYVCEFSANLCKDSGFSSVASQIEMAGKLSILVMSMPVIMSLLDTINSFLK